MKKILLNEKEYNMAFNFKVMKNICIENSITKAAMPTIGCGLDGLKWNKVKEIIQNVFSDTNIDILVCKR